MTRTRMLVFATFFLAVSNAEAANTVTLNQPTNPANGTIGGDGTYNVDGGYTLLSITLIAMPTGGGQGGEAGATLDTKNLTWVASVTGLAQGQLQLKPYARRNLRRRTADFSANSGWSPP